MIGDITYALMLKENKEFFDKESDNAGWSGATTPHLYKACFFDDEFDAAHYLRSRGWNRNEWKIIRVHLSTTGEEAR